MTQWKGQLQMYSSRNRGIELIGQIKYKLSCMEETIEEGYESNVEPIVDSLEDISRQLEELLDRYY